MYKKIDFARPGAGQEGRGRRKEGRGDGRGTGWEWFRRCLT